MSAHCPNCLQYRLSQNYCITAPSLGQFIWALSRKDYITEIVLEFFMGVVILTGDLSDFCTVISGEWGLWEN